MTRTLAAALVMLLFAGAAQAAQPTVLTGDQMDRVTAGGGGNPYEALLAALPGGFVLDGARLNHKRAALRFQPAEPNKGIAIPGGSHANFEHSVLRASGDPTFGAVVVLY